MVGKTLLAVVPHVAQAANGKQQMEPMLEGLRNRPEALNAPGALLADTGYFSEPNVKACLDAEIEPLIAPGRAANGSPGTAWKPGRIPR